MAVLKVDLCPFAVLIRWKVLIWCLHTYIHSYPICPSSFFSDCPFKVQNMRFNVCLTICMLITIYEYLLFCMLKLLVSKSADLVLDARLSPPRCEAKERDCLTKTRTNTIGWVDFKIFQELWKKFKWCYSRFPKILGKT